ncbi:hypothetical protein O6H91_15G054100 [Diphasiastrum complanatum]|uniref:Uncharacterized protein n=1 Tax=Diphasiastrum complanatum TaxID=34168 RepID=A0ACC2BIF9_DIPCM|nr:hypothetical protein O6H91_15G054100 [Diphasiastrum complanatum]
MCRVQKLVAAKLVVLVRYEASSWLPTDKNLEQMRDFLPTLLQWIMHDWDEEHCTKILSNCYRALPEKGKVIIIDIVLDPSEEADPYSNIKNSFDLVMIAHTNGMERTREEWHNLLTKSDFPSYKIFQIPNLQFIIEAYKA